MPRSETTYIFSSPPVPIITPIQKRQKRPNPKQYGLTNYDIPSYDRRIVRGLTSAHRKALEETPVLWKHQQEKFKTCKHVPVNSLLRAATPPPVAGRLHVPVQTEMFLEELHARVEDSDAQCQTDALLDRPPSPLFVPAKVGVDVATQIEEGDLFDFDREIQPVLEVLVGQVMEQALEEVMQEEELAELRKQQKQFEEMFFAELLEKQRLEEQERRFEEEREARLEQYKEALKVVEETSQKVTACVFAKSYLAELVPSVFAKLEDQGYFAPPISSEVEESFLPWLLNEVEQELSKVALSRQLLDGLLEEAVAITMQGRQIEPVLPEV